MTANENPRLAALLDDLRLKFRAKYEASPALRAEFAAAEDYAEFELNHPATKKLIGRWCANFDDADNIAAYLAAGRVRILGQ